MDVNDAQDSIANIKRNKNQGKRRSKAEEVITRVAACNRSAKTTRVVRDPVPLDERSQIPEVTFKPLLTRLFSICFFTGKKTAPNTSGTIFRAISSLYSGKG